MLDICHRVHIHFCEKEKKNNTEREHMKGEKKKNER